MSDTETKTKQEHEAKMQTMRAEFAQAWPIILEKMCKTYNNPDHGELHYCAWLTWCAAKGTS